MNAVRQGEIPEQKKIAAGIYPRSKGRLCGGRERGLRGGASPFDQELAHAGSTPGVTGGTEAAARRGGGVAAALVLVVMRVMMVAAGCRRQAKSGGPVTRIVTLTPSATEIVAALGATDLLVAVDDYSTYPPEVAKLPRVGSFLQPHLEAIIRARPQVVIADDVHADVARSMADVGIEVVTAPMHSLPDLKVAFARIGARLGRDEQARAQADGIEAAIEAARRRKVGAGQRVLIVIDREAGGLAGMVGAATGSWLDELVAICGADNVLAGSPVRYPKLSPEEVLRSRADVILDVSFAADPDDARRAWATMPTVPAVASGRVRLLKEPYLLSPSPRVAEALAALEAALAR
jgi:iron complex transport system substrate-binding protein